MFPTNSSTGGRWEDDDMFEDSSKTSELESPRQGQENANTSTASASTIQRKAASGVFGKSALKMVSTPKTTSAIAAAAAAAAARKSAPADGRRASHGDDDDAFTFDMVFEDKTEFSMVR
jgi:hypothetical protein